MHLECCWLHKGLVRINMKRWRCSHWGKSLKSSSLVLFYQLLDTETYLKACYWLKPFPACPINAKPWAVYGNIVNDCVEQWMNWLACREQEVNAKTDALTHAQSARFINAHSQPLPHIFNDNTNMSAWSTACNTY